VLGNGQRWRVVLLYSSTTLAVFPGGAAPLWSPQLHDGSALGGGAAVGGVMGCRRDVRLAAGAVRG
jgi:hypothetical protein